LSTSNRELDSKAMKVLFVSAEVAPFAKVGGLADVVGALPKELVKLGWDARIVMPDYAMIESSGKYKITTIAENVPVEVRPGWVKPTRVRLINHNGVKVYLVGTDEWFQDADRSETIYRVGIDQYLYFARATLALPDVLGWQPDLIHAHDWHTGFVPVLMRESEPEKWEDVASVFTIHNLAYQGEFGIDILDRLGLSHELFNSDKVEAYGRVNFLKSGASYADAVNTVSESYSKEVQTPEFGCHLQGLMIHLADQHRLYGIRNGIDTAVFNPATDPEIPASYSANEVSGKKACKKALLKFIGMKPIPKAPLLGIVSRISSQKGLDLVIKAADTLFDMPCQLVILGSGEPHLVESLHRIAGAHPLNFRFFEGYHEELAPKIYAGCDGFLMPSAFEPCGLGQMIAMRYGTVPIVRATGGLRNTVFEAENGFVFENKSSAEFSDAIVRFCDAYASLSLFSKIQSTGMHTDFGWETGAKKYIELYEATVQRRVQLGEKSA